jgi:hypothetical protein
MDPGRQEDGVLALVTPWLVVLIALLGRHLESTQHRPIIGLLILFVLWILFLLALLLLLFFQDLVNLNVVFFHIVSDGQYVAGLASNCIAQLLALVDVGQVIMVKLLVYQEQVVFKITQSVRLKVSEVGDVILIVEFVAKAEGVERDHLTCLILILVAWDVVLVELVIWSALSHLGPQLILVVAHIFTATPPEIGAVLPIALCRINKGFHADLVA